MLHRLVYASAVLGVTHYYWLVKSDVRSPLFYGAIIGLLLLYRAVKALRAVRVSRAAELKVAAQ
jgi:sulfoxide reductase heme-binding subunit YedZ